MSITQNDKELIERYLDDNMTTSEIIEFEKRLDIDTELSDELVMHKTAVGSLKKNESLKEELKEIFNEVKKEQAQGPKSTRPIYWTAAAVILILVSTFTVYYVSKTQNYQSLYLSYYRPLSGVDVNRDGEFLLEDQDETVAMQLYQIRHFEEAAEKFNILTKRTVINDKWWVYLANCYMSTGQPQQARQALQNALNASSSFTRQHARWYLTLLDIHDGKIQAAQTSLENIQQDGGVYERDARLLLEDLD